MVHAVYIRPVLRGGLTCSVTTEAALKDVG